MEEITVCEIIRKSRKCAGMTQQDISDKLGLSRATIAKYETGAISPTIDRLIDIMDAMGFRVDILIQKAADRTEVTA